MCKQKPYQVWFSCRHKSYQGSGGSREGVWGATPLIFRDRGPLYLRVWMTEPPLPYLKVWIHYCSYSVTTAFIGKNPFTSLMFEKKSTAKSKSLSYTYLSC